ncbi:MAG TPA: 2OG-Fe(II) oxygenase [Chloroflexota bacterium]|nr:2OG-Fe(II) oxygenase [Chloroflexota bacterium]
MPALTQLCDSPRLYVLDHFASDSEIAHVLSLAADAYALQARGISPKHDETGFSFEMPVEGDEVLEALRRRVAAVVGLENDFGSTFRFRRYAAGEQHPLHPDCYQIGELHLVATALLCLEAPLSGGETSFPRAFPAPASVSPKAGRLVVWWNYLPDGREDASAHHASLPVTAGEKTTITAFIYKPLASAAATPPEVVAAEPRDEPRRFFCVDDGVPEETVRLLREACTARGVQFVPIDPRTFDYEPGRQLSPGALLYRPAVSLAARRVEQFLYAEGVATFYSQPDGVFFDCITSPLYFERAGLPIARTIYCSTTDRETLRSYVRQLGGLPIVVKLLGASSGIGVIRVDSLAALFSLIDYLRSQGSNPLLCAYVPDAVHWRLVVVGEQVVAAYRNITDTDDFRTYADHDPANYSIEVRPDMAEVAVGACRLLGHEFGGVDVLEHASGRLYLLEANFPAYFPQAQLVTGVDIAGAMVDHLLAKAERLAPARQQELAASR